MLNNNLNVKTIEHLETIAKKSNSAPLSLITLSNKYPKIVGDIRHYPPANKEWKNSIYAYNKNSLRSLSALDKMASKTIKSYFSLSNNKKLARSQRMRNLIRRTTVKRLFVSKPEIKQTSDKVNITVYTFNRERQFFLRKMYFYNRNTNINKNIYFYKLWLKKNLLAFKKTFYNKKSIIPYHSKKKIRKIRKLMTKRRKKNKTYMHNILLKKYFLSKSLAKKGRRSLSENRFSKKLQGVNNLVRNNLVKSLKKRNLMRFMQKRANKKIKLAIPLKRITSNLKSLDLLPNIYEKKIFKNYLVKKIDKKTRYKLRNFNSIMKIVEKLKRQKRFRFKIRLPYSNFKFKNEIRFFSFKLVSELKYIRRLFKFYFIKWLLNQLDINLARGLARGKEKSSSKNKIKSFYLAEKKSKFNVYDRKNKFIKGFNEIKEIAKHFKVKQNTVIKCVEKRKLFKNYYKIKSEKILEVNEFKKKYSYDKIKNIEQLNLELLHKLKIILRASVPFFKAKKKNNLKKNKNSFYTILFSKNKKTNIDFLYKKFEKEYFLNYLAKFFKREFLYINYYSKFLINQLKFGKFLPGLKILISKIYSKKVELNLVNLKYPQLNSDIYTQAIATKLKRKLGLLRVLKWSLNLAKLPSDYLSYNRTGIVNNLQPLIIHKSLDINVLTEGENKSILKEYTKNAVEKKLFEGINKPKISKDKLDDILNKLYPCSFVHEYSPFSRQMNGQIEKSDSLKEKLKNSNLNLFKPEKKEDKGNLMKSLNVLNIIRYKWVSGVRLEAAGRLTRRYTAARSVFKFRYKGNLKNIDYSLKLDTTKKNMSTVMLRNQVKSNSQYSFIKSKRRIGAFGLKAWIGGY